MSVAVSEIPSTQTFKKYFKLLLAEEKEDLWILVVYGIWVSVCSLIIPIAVQTFVNTIGFGLLMQPILILTLIVFTVLAFSGAIRALQIYVTELLQQRLFAKLAVELAYRIPRVRMEVFEVNHGTEWVNRFFDVVTVQKTLTAVFVDGIAVFLQVVFGMLLLAFYHPFLLTLNLLIVFFVSLFFFRLAKSAVETSIQESKTKYSVAAWLQDLARNSRSFRTPESRKFAMNQADILASEYIVKRRKHFKILFRQILAGTVLQILVNALLLGVGGWLVVKEQLTLGQLVASELVLSSVIAGIGKFGKYLESYYDLAAALDKTGHLLELPLERLDGETAEVLRPEVPLIEARNLGLGHSLLNFRVHKGEKFGVVGPSGSGKTRLTQVLFGLKEPVSGVIEVGGVGLKYSILQNIRSQIAYVSGVELFEGTLLDNIRLNQTDASIHLVQRVLRDLGLEEVVASLPEGLNTLISGGQFPFSSSQARKIMMARAIVAHPKLIILDEILDEVDVQSDQHLRAFFLRKDLEFALIVTARSMERTWFCDRILEMPSEPRSELRGES
jgi:ABC-type bacteriocin/lantibiotic exporter with double-glycine peptidase domain